MSKPLKNALPAGLLALALLAGCGPAPTSPPVVTQPAGGKIEVPLPEVGPRAIADGPKPAGPELPSALTDEPADAGQIIEETWDAYFIQGARVGYAHTVIAHVEEGGERLVRIRNTSQTTLKRGGQTIRQDLTLTSWERPSGELVRFESSMTTGPGEMVSRGRVQDGKLHIQTETLGKSESQAIDWPSGTGGFFAAEQSLRKQPLKPGEERTVRGLLPVFNIAGQTELEAHASEDVKLPGGDLRLLKVTSVIDLGTQKLDTILWMDEQGVVQKSLVPSIGQEAVRTVKADALQRLEGQEFDLLAASGVKLKGELPNALATRQVVYLAKVTSGKIKGVFAEGPSQSVKLIDQSTAEITVRAIRPRAADEPRWETPAPQDEDLTPNNMIQSDDPLVVQMAAAAAPESTDPWEVALALEKYVSTTIKKKNFTQAFATAGEVARTLEGDCTEHAVLLAALCRARQIPCRVAFGLVHYPPQKGFAYHMWNEAFISDRWVPLDGTLGRGGVAADRLKLADTSLRGATGLTAMLPVVQVFGRLQLEVLSAE